MSIRERLRIVGARVKPCNCMTIFSRGQQKWFIWIWSQIQNIEQFVKERQEIKPKKLQTCESYFSTFPKKNMRCMRFALQKTVQVDTSFYQDTDEMF